MSNVHESSKDRFHVVFPWLYKTYFGGMQSLFLIVPIMNWEGILFSTILFLNANPGTRKVHYTKMLQKRIHLKAFSFVTRIALKNQQKVSRQVAHDFVALALKRSVLFSVNIIEENAINLIKSRFCRNYKQCFFSSAEIVYTFCSNNDFCKELFSYSTLVQKFMYC